MQVKFDHIYTVDKGFGFRAKIASLGFELYKKDARHPGTICKFIRMREQYLEFIQFVGKPPYKHPAISCASKEDFQKMRKEFTAKGKLKFTYLHRPYDWQNSESGPGWHFIRFPGAPKAAGIWLTQYDHVAGRPPRQKGNKEAISAIHILVSPKDEIFYKNLFGRKKLGRVELACGTVFLFTPAKRTKISEVVIGVKDLDRLQGKGLTLDLWDGRPALRLKNPNKGMWDVLFVRD